MLLAAALVADRDPQAGVQERELAQALGQHVEIVVGDRKDLGIGEKGHPRARLVRGPDLLEGALGLAARVGLAPHHALAPDLELEPRGKGVDDRDPDAVQAARDLVGLIVELAAGMERGHDDLGSRSLLAGVLVYRNAAAVVADGDAAVLVEDHLDQAAVARHRLVHRVVDDLVDEVVETVWARGSDVHRGPLADGIEALEDLDGTGVVAHWAGVLGAGGGSRGMRRGRVPEA